MEGQPAPNQQREAPPSKEQIQRPIPMIGLQARMLLGGEAINPNKRDLPPVTKEGLGTFEKRDYGAVERASKNERRTHWRGKEGNDLERQKRAWIENTVRTFQHAREFFLNNPKGQQWGELFARLPVPIDAGTSTEHGFTAERATALYKRYFEDNKGSSIRRFVEDIVLQYQTPNGIDYQRLIQDLPAVEWLSHIFGNTSSEVIGQLVEAEAKLLDQKLAEQFISQANETQTVNGQQTIRINNIETGSNEERLLRFLWEGQSAQIGIVQRPQRGELPKGYRLHYDEGPRKTPREFPAESIVDYLQNPTFIAEQLKSRYPQLYGNMATETLAQDIGREQEALRTLLHGMGLTEEHLKTTLAKTLSHYEQFLKQQYGIDIPDIQRLHLIPVDGKAAQLYHPRREALAFINPAYPAIFLDIGTISAFARKLAHKELGAMTQEEFGQFMEERLLAEITPHEETHLLADLAFWQLYKLEGDKEKLVRIAPGRLGLTLTKPTKPYVKDEEFIYKERGRSLMEAVTVELTDEWARSMHHSLDVNAYPQEREVLHALVDMLSKEQHVSQEESFKAFVQAYFSKWGLRRLDEALSGVTREGGKTSRSRPYFMQELYAVMTYEEDKAGGQGQTDFSLTHAFIEKRGHVGNLTDMQKAKMRDIVQKALLGDAPYYLSPAAMEHLASQLGLPIEKPKIPTQQEYPQVRNADEVAAALIDYETGAIKDAKVDLRENFAGIVANVEERVQGNDSLFAGDKPTVVLSETAIAMIEQIATASNAKDGELLFVIQGVSINTAAPNEILVGAYAVPAMDYTHTQKSVSNAVPEIHNRNSSLLAKNTNLKDYFREKTGSENGEAMLTCHIHQASHGPSWRAHPSTQDKEQNEQYLRDNPDIPRYWGVITKDNEGTHINFILTTSKNGKITHDEGLPFVVFER